jgi:hypothetical protein
VRSPATPATADVAFAAVVFSVEERERVRDRLVELAHADPRVVACAVIGAEAKGRVDRWSDVDLTLGVAAGAPVADVVEDWTRALAGELGAVHLFDLTVMTSLYRVFLLGSNLQVDVSFTPENDFGPRGPHFRLLFGNAVERAPAEPPPAKHLFGLGVHHAVRARFCIERERPWQAEYWISALRDHALELACLREGQETAYGRGFDRLPDAVLHGAGQALVRSPERGELLRALGAGVELLLREADEVDGDTARLADQLRELADPAALAEPVQRKHLQPPRRA